MSTGGEKKRLEVLQLNLLKPKLTILDETDSGLDVDALKLLFRNIAAQKDEQRSLLIITHYERVFDYIRPDFALLHTDSYTRAFRFVNVAKAIRNVFGDRAATACSGVTAANNWTSSASALAAAAMSVRRSSGLEGVSM